MTMDEKEKTSPIRVKQQKKTRSAWLQVLFVLAVGSLIAALILTGVVAKHENDYADRFTRVFL